MNKEAIRKSFSRYAPYYDSYCAIQDLCARELISRIKNNGFCNILDIGCGTGNYTRLLKEKFPYARITAIDISDRMTQIARDKLKGSDIAFIANDAEAVRFKERFDLISSNAAFQWLGDLEKTLTHYRDLLKDGGIISFSIFGPQTFYELDASIKELFKKDISISASNFLEYSQTKRALNSYFDNVSLKERIYTEEYNTLRELLDKIRYTGTRGCGANNGTIWTQKTIDDLEKVYRDKFGKITAAYQVFFCEGSR